jgi:hypothetical protein
VGDSELIINFATRAYRPGDATLFIVNRRIQHLCRKLRPKPQFLHVKRNKNKLADWACNLAKQTQVDTALEVEFPQITIDSSPPSQP